MTTKRKTIKITVVSVIALITAIITSLFWVFGVATTANTAKACAEKNSPRIAAVENRVTIVETKQQERHQAILGEFRKVNEKLDKL